MQWEYQFYVPAPDRDHKQLEEAMNELGQDRWELATTYMNAEDVNVFVLKRQRR